jgi:succinate-semialdehyde dehydrogenase/glutarate-semialdehyde dehydrogenase
VRPPGAASARGRTPPKLFGPVAQVYRVSSEEEAVKLTNDTPFGLRSYLVATD